MNLVALPPPPLPQCSDGAQSEDDAAAPLRYHLYEVQRPDPGGGSPLAHATGKRPIELSAGLTGDVHVVCYSCGTPVPIDERLLLVS